MSDISIQATVKKKKLFKKKARGDGGGAPNKHRMLIAYSEKKKDN